MKVIINVPKYSAYAHLNGLSFEVKEVLQGMVAVKLDNIKTDFKEKDTVTADFSFKEVMVQNFQDEYQSAYDSHNFNGLRSKDYYFLRNYKEHNKIEFVPEYTCPA